jgi:hypothetical protein
MNSLNLDVFIPLMTAIVGGLATAIWALYTYFNQRKYEKQEYRERRDEERKYEERKERLTFLASIIVDKDRPLEYRKPFFDEYMAAGGNGTVSSAFVCELEKLSNYKK